MCKSSDVATGSSAVKSFVVSPQDLAIAVGSGDVRVVGTPVVIAWMEQVTVEAMTSCIEPGCTSVGIHIDVRHQVPSVVGETLEVTAVVREVIGMKIHFDVSATTGDRVVAHGTITRAHVTREGVFAD
jgi:fluoroacetyl-CoA thioesterase